MNTTKLAESFGTDLSSRSNAAMLRRDLCAAIDHGADVQEVLLDFQDVRTLSSSFADELVAVLVLERGEEWFKQHVRLLNLSDDIRTAILEAVSERLERNGLQAKP